MDDDDTFSLIAFSYCLIMFTLYAVASITFTGKLKKRPDWINILLAIVYFISFLQKVIDRGFTYFYKQEESPQDIFDLIETVCIFFNYTVFYYLAFEARIVQTVIQCQNVIEFKMKIRTLKLLRFIFICIYGFQTIVSGISIYYELINKDANDQILKIFELIARVCVLITDSTVIVIICLFIRFYLKRKAESFEQQESDFTSKERSLIIWVFFVIIFNVIDQISDFVIGIWFEHGNSDNLLIFEIQMFFWFPFLDLCNSITFLYLSYCQNSSQFNRNMSHASTNKEDVARNTSALNRFLRQYTKTSSQSQKMTEQEPLSSKHRNQSANYQTNSSNSINRLEESNHDMKGSFDDSNSIESISSNFGSYLMSLMNKKQQQQLIKKYATRPHQQQSNNTIMETPLD